MPSKRNSNNKKDKKNNKRGNINKEKRYDIINKGKDNINSNDGDKENDVTDDEEYMKIV